MKKDYHNKFAPDIWCIFGGFQFLQNQVTNEYPDLNCVPMKLLSTEFF